MRWKFRKFCIGTNTQVMVDIGDTESNYLLDAVTSHIFLVRSIVGFTGKYFYNECPWRNCRLKVIGITSASANRSMYAFKYEQRRNNVLEIQKRFIYLFCTLSVRQSILDSTVLNVYNDISDHRMVRTRLRMSFSWPKRKSEDIFVKITTGVLGTVKKRYLFKIPFNVAGYLLRRRAIDTKHKIRKQNGDKSLEHKISKAESKKLVKKDRLKQVEKDIDAISSLPPRKQYYAAIKRLKSKPKDIISWGIKVSNGNILTDKNSPKTILLLPMLMTLSKMKYQQYSDVKSLMQYENWNALDYIISIQNISRQVENLSRKLCYIYSIRF